MNLFLIGIFTLFVYKSLIIVVENFLKYHWIQHKKTQPIVVVVGCPARRDLAVSTRKATEEAAQVGAGPEWEGQRKEESEESSKGRPTFPTPGLYA